MTESDPVRDAEFGQDNYARVEADIKEALKRSGCIYPAGVIEALTCTVLEESLETRRRMAFMVSTFIEHFEKPSKTQLERLAMVMLFHYRDADNLGYMPLPPDGVELS